MGVNEPRFSRAAFDHALDVWTRKAEHPGGLGARPFSIGYALDCAHRTNGPIRMQAKIIAARRIASRVGLPPLELNDPDENKLWREQASWLLSRAFDHADDCWIRVLALAFTRGALLASERAPADPAAPTRESRLFDAVLDPAFPLDQSLPFNQLFVHCLAQAIATEAPEQEEALLLAASSLRESFDPAGSVGEALARHFLSRHPPLPVGVHSWRHAQLFSSRLFSRLIAASGLETDPHRSFWRQAQSRSARDSESWNGDWHAETRLRKGAQSFADYLSGSADQGPRMAALCASPSPPAFAMAAMLACKGLPCAAEVAAAARQNFEAAKSNPILQSMAPEADSMMLRLSMDAELCLPPSSPALRL